MLLANSVSTKEGEIDYAVEYLITQNGADEDDEKETEYGIKCSLYKAGTMVDSEEVCRITSEKKRVEKILCILEKNQVFPAHIRDVIEDLLIIEFEEKACMMFT